MALSHLKLLYLFITRSETGANETLMKANQKRVEHINLIHVFFITGRVRSLSGLVQLQKNIPENSMYIVGLKSRKITDSMDRL